MERDAVLNVRVPLSMKRAVQLAAEDDHGRSMSGMVVRMLSEWLAQHGYPVKPAGRSEKAGR
jgi:hypothetical protein